MSQNGSNTDLVHFTKTKGIGRALHNQVHDGAKTSCDCEAIGPIGGGRGSDQTLVNHNRLFTFTFVAFSNKYFTGSPAACESGVAEYRKYQQDIYGKVDNAHVTERECEQFYKGTGDSGAPTGSGRGLLGLVSDLRGDSTKAKHMSDVYPSGRWVVPHRLPSANET